MNLQQAPSSGDREEDPGHHREEVHSGVEILKGGPLGDQLLMPHQLITASLIRLEQVLVAKGRQLLPQGVEDRVVLVQESRANLQILTEVEDVASAT